jgi:hypothetical protein
MVTYAVLGATGQTGSEIVEALLPTPAHLNIYARSLDRLYTMHSDLITAANVTLFIGDLEDNKLLTACVEDADIVLSTVAQNRNEPGCSFAQRTSWAMIQALKPKRTTGNCPVVVFLASAGIDPNVPLNKIFPRNIAHCVLYHVYTDLERSIELLQSHPWIPLVIAAAGGLVHDEPRGIELTGKTETSSKLLSYADLARGMIQMGDEDGEKWSGRWVGMIASQGKPIKGNPLALLRYLLPNLLAMICPPLWWLGRNWWAT